MGQVVEGVWDGCRRGATDRKKWAWEHEMALFLGAGAFVVYLCLRDYSKNGVCQMGYSRLMKLTGTRSVNSLRKYLRILIGEGLVKVDSPPGPREATIYSIVEH